jgi:SulP family sulfate permease
MSRDLLHRYVPITEWLPRYARRDLRSDLSAGLTIGAMLVPQGMAYALLAGLPPEVGLFASIVPVLVYAVFGTSRQLAVGPVATVSLMTAAVIAPMFEQDAAGYLGSAALLALMVGAIHLVLGVGRLGFVVDFLSNSVLVGFTAASAILIAVSQVKHVLGVSIPRSPALGTTVTELARAIGDTNAATLSIGLASMAVLVALKRISRRLPSALIVVVASIVAVRVLDLRSHGVATVGDIPGSIAGFAIPALDGGRVGTLASAALAITLVGFMQSIAAAKVYARRHRYDIDANQELIAVGMSNVAAGLFGGFSVTGGFSRTAVNDASGARTQLASIVTALVVLVTVLFFTPLFSALPQAALAAIIIMAVVNLVDVREIRNIARVKRSDLIGLSVAFVGTLALSIEVGILIAVVASMLVVFARMSRPHRAALGRIPGTTSYRNLERFPEAEVEDGIRIVRIDAALSFVNAQHVKRVCLGEAAALVAPPRALVLDCSGINDVDATGVDVLGEIVTEIDEGPATLHLCDVKGPVRDVLRRAGLWDRLDGRVHATPHQAVQSIRGDRDRPASLRAAGIDERDADPAALVGAIAASATPTPTARSDTAPDTAPDTPGTT